MSGASSRAQGVVGLVGGIILISAGGSLIALASGGDAMLLLMAGGIAALVAGVVLVGWSLSRLIRGDRSRLCPSCMDPIVPGATSCPNCGYVYAS